MKDFITDKCIFIEKARVTKEQISWLAGATVEQRKSALWGQFHTLRLIGSNCGEVIAACLRTQQSQTPFPPSPLQIMRGKYSLGSKDSVLWGQLHEASAIATYQEITLEITFSHLVLSCFLVGFWEVVLMGYLLISVKRGQLLKGY